LGGVNAVGQLGRYLHSACVVARIPFAIGDFIVVALHCISRRSFVWYARVTGFASIQVAESSFEDWNGGFAAHACMPFLGSNILRIKALLTAQVQSKPIQKFTGNRKN